MTISTLDLKSEAAAEAARLARARATGNCGSDRVRLLWDCGRPLVARTRRVSARRFLHGRILMIWRIAFEDARGRAAESHLVPMLVAPTERPHGARRRALIREQLREMEAPLRRFVEDAEPAWRAAVLRVQERFASSRADRERAVAAHFALEREELFQTGLFDRRSERARKLAGDAASDAARDARARLDAAADARHLSARAGELLLVLTP